MEEYRVDNLLKETTPEDILAVACESLTAFSITKANAQYNEQYIHSDSLIVNNSIIANSLDSAITAEFVNAFDGCASEMEVRENLLSLQRRIHNTQTDSLILLSFDSGIAVALASLHYWKEHYQEWYNATHILQETPATKSGNINGRVLGEHQEPIVGASVQVQGTTFGVVTDLDGNFTLSMPLGHDTIVVSYVGYETATIALQGRTELVITLAEDAQSLWDTIAPIASADGISAISATATSLALGPLSWSGVAVGAIVGSLVYCLQQVLP